MLLLFFGAERGQFCFRILFLLGLAPKFILRTLTDGVLQRGMRFAWVRILLEKLRLALVTQPPGRRPLDFLTVAAGGLILDWAHVLHMKVFVGRVAGRNGILSAGTH